MHSPDVLAIADLGQITVLSPFDFIKVNST